MNQKQTKPVQTHILVECALLVALASVLCEFPKFKFLASGGSITLCSMLPILLISYRRGLKWGFLSSVVFAFVQIITGLSLAGADLFSIIMGVALDYILAFGVLGLGGLFRDKFKSRGAELALGSFVALILRFLCHFASGYILWGSIYASGFFEDVGAWGASVLQSVSGNALIALYSFIYNSSYMIPEIVLTLIACFLISKFALYKIDEAKTA